MGDWLGLVGRVWEGGGRDRRQVRAANIGCRPTATDGLQLFSEATLAGGIVAAVTPTVLAVCRHLRSSTGPVYLHLPAPTSKNVYHSQHGSVQKVSVLRHHKALNVPVLSIMIKGECSSCPSI